MTPNESLNTTEMTSKPRKSFPWFKIVVIVMLAFIVLHLLYFDIEMYRLAHLFDDTFKDTPSLNIPDYEPPSSDEIWPTEEPTP